MTRQLDLYEEFHETLAELLYDPAYDTVRCEACGASIAKDDSERDEDDTVYLCAECGESIRKMNSGRVA
jgi:DNA-directed RNA polymerase subunit RPC12/RpoP